jgi:hypothetical protein
MAPTYGEKLLNRLLRELPKKQFFFQYEPQIVTPDGYSKPDFVIVSALRGVVILEVKDWVRLTGGDQALIHTVSSRGVEQNFENPIRAAERYAYDLKKRFETRTELWEQYKGRRALKFPWQIMIALPRISQKVVAQFEKKGVWPRGIVIGKEHLASAASLQQAINNLPWKFQLEQPFSLDMLDIIREILNPSLVVQNEDGFPTGILTQLQHGLINEPLRSLQPKQLSLFEYDMLSDEVVDIPGSATIRLLRGVAGSGKTLVLVRRVRHLAEQYPQARLLVMTFNVELASDLQSRLPHPVEVASFHRICRRILGARWLEPIRTRDWLRQYAGEELRALGLPAEFVASEFGWRKEMSLLNDRSYLEADRFGRGQRLDHAKRQQINNLFNRYRAFQKAQRLVDWDDVSFLALEVISGQSPTADSRQPTANSALRTSCPYDAIFIDEAQDFAPSWMRVAQALLKPNGSLFICDDPSQSIFCSYTWAQKGLSVVGRTRVLHVPFRSTREISQAAHSLIEADETLRQYEERAEPDFNSYELNSGPLPALIACKDGETEQIFVEGKIQELLAAGIAPGQIAILCHARWHIERWAKWREQGIYLQYYAKIKGLEFMVVFLPQLHDVFRLPDDPDAVTATRRKLFTAMTRARYRLMMSYQGTLPRPLEPLLEHVWCEAFDTVRTP